MISTQRKTQLNFSNLQNSQQWGLAWYVKKWPQMWKDMDNCQYIMQFPSEHPNSPSVSCIRLQSKSAIWKWWWRCSWHPFWPACCAAGFAEPLWVPERTEASPASGQELGSPHIGQDPLQPPAQSPGSNGARATLSLCTESGQTHPGHSLQTVFMTCVFAVFQSPRGELRALAAALSQSPESLGCPACWSMAGACGSSGTWEEATTSGLDVMCLTPRCLLGSFRHSAHSSVAEGRSKNRT